MVRLLAAACCLLLLPGGALAHHAKEYIETESFAQPPQLGLAAFVRFDYYNETDSARWELTPIVAFGLHDRLMLGVHSHLLNVGDHDPFFEVFAVGLQGQITPPGWWWVDIAVGVEYEVPLPDSRELLDGKHILTTTLIVSRELPLDINATANFYYSQEVGFGDGYEMGWAIAGKGHVVPPWGWLEGGLEVVGTFDAEPRLALIPGLYASPLGFLTLKLAVSVGLTAHSDAWGIHVALALSFDLGSPDVVFGP